MTESSTTNKPVPATETIDFLTRERQTILGAAETTLTETHLQHYDAAGELEKNGVWKGCSTVSWSRSRSKT